MSTELAIRPDQTSFDDKQVAALRSLGVEDAPPGDVALLFHQAVRTGLDPFARQIYLIGRASRVQERGQWVDGPKKWTIQTGIEGYRVTRDRISAEHPDRAWRGQVEQWCGDDGAWTDVWLSSQPPAAARVLVYMEGKEKPVSGVALWREYAAFGRDGQPQAMWKKMPANQLLKCAEALALRKAYPQDLGGTYVDAEMDQADVGSDGVPSVTKVQPPQQKQQAAKQPLKDLNAAKRPPVLEPSEEQQAAIVEFADAITETDSVNALRALHHEADQRHLLAYPTREGVRLNDLFHARKAYLSQRDAEDLPPALDGIEDDGEVV